nr:MAG TPA: hypothetical protein [Caudoviricetes sp.]
MTAGDYLPICKGGSWQINTTDTRWGGIRRGRGD